MTWAFNQVQLALSNFNNRYFSSVIQDCINDKDKKVAEILLRDYKLTIPQSLLITT